MANISIIGFGEIGQAINFVLKDTSHQVLLWDRDPNKISGMESLEKVVSESNVLFICVPSWAIGEVLDKIIPIINPQTIILTPTKGIDEQTLRTIPELIAEKLPQNPVGLISGPMLAEELMAGKKGFAVLASKDDSLLFLTMEIFKNTNLSLRHSKDVTGVALCGVLKNIYSVCLGVADGLELGNNSKGNLAFQALTEMGKIVQILGGERETVFGIAGLADFIATGFSDFSKNRKSGYEMGKNGTCELKSEGVASVRSIVKLLGPNSSEFTLLTALDNACVQSQNTKTEFEKLLK